jgi:hypothetical protein
MSGPESPRRSTSPIGTGWTRRHVACRDLRAAIEHEGERSARYLKARDVGDGDRSEDSKYVAPPGREGRAAPPVSVFLSRPCTSCRRS